MRLPEGGSAGRWLSLAAVPALIGGALAVGAGWKAREPASGPKPPAASQPAALAGGEATGAPAAPDTAGAPPATTVPPAPAVDPRIVRALAARVCLRAGKAELWTELRRLGVGLTWPEAGNPNWSLDEALFDRALRRLGRRAERWPRNARLMHASGAFKAAPGHSGRRLDRAEAKRLLLAAIDTPEFREALNSPPAEKLPPTKLTIPLHDVLPTVTPAHLGRINTLLATYSTGLGSSSRNRRHNIRLACEAIDGTVLRPGELFSYNQTVGPRSERAGFRTAPVIIHGELVPGTGGGICQVSTTLYNAALLADLKVVRRSHHQFPVHYVPPGRDATVAFGSLDLRFANSLPSPVALEVKQQGSRVVVHVYGAPECRRHVQIVNSRVSWTRPRVPAGGGPARPGKRVIVSRVVQLADGTARHEVISRDTYAPPPSSSPTPSHPRRPKRRRRFSSSRPGGTESSPTAAKPPSPAAREPERSGLVRTAPL